MEFKNLVIKPNKSVFSVTKAPSLLCEAFFFSLTHTSHGRILDKETTHWSLLHYQPSKILN